jgi:hypothetical protein
MERVFHGASCRWGELPMGPAGHWASFPWGELSMGLSVMRNRKSSARLARDGMEDSSHPCNSV